MAFTGRLRAMPKRLIVGITGATGAIYGISLLRALKELGGWESHLVLTDAGVLNVWHEHKMKRKDVERLAHVAYHPKDIGATIASGSFVTEGMVIAPCSMKTLAACSTFEMCAACGIITSLAPGTFSPMWRVPGAEGSCSPAIASTGSLISFRRAVVLSFMIAWPQPT